ncbi:MAG: hypothetical protein DLD55_05155 [candidate division SR1 bacterium]|nr:MAG: hypothetical protein DLD55_05155 [candidate division SR1 bacterium]
MAIHLKASVIARRNRGDPLEIQSAYPLDCFAPLAMTVIAKEQSETKRSTRNPKRTSTSKLRSFPYRSGPTPANDLGAHEVGGSEPP